MATRSGEGLSGSCMVESEESCVLNCTTLLVNSNLISKTDSINLGSSIQEFKY